MSFYVKLLGEKTASLEGIQLPAIKQGPLLGQHEAAMLIAPIVEEEVKQALGAIDDHKAPGCDALMPSSLNRYGTFFRRMLKVLLICFLLMLLCVEL